MASPLTERKALLQELMAGAPDKLLYSEHFAEPGDEVLSHACDLALEGIVSKRAEAPYRSGRTDLWLKSKCIKEQELVIGGYTEQPNHPGVLGILLFQGLREDKPAREVVREKEKPLSAIAKPGTYVADALGESAEGRRKRRPCRHHASRSRAVAGCRHHQA